MNMEKISAIKQRHLATKQQIMADEAAKARVDYIHTVATICDYILHYLDSDNAYDKKGVGGEYYRNTAWIEVKHDMPRFDGVVKARLHLTLPKDSCYISSFDYSDKEFTQLLCDVFEKFKQLEGFEVIGYRIIMLLEE